MKTLFKSSLLICMLHFNPCIYAQKPIQGIYLSSDDFVKNKLSYKPESGNTYHIHLNEIFYKPTIKVSNSDSAVTLNKATLFGFRDQENKSYRFYEKQIYQLLNPGERILIYSKTTNGVPKSAQRITSYFFSNGADASILPLTKQNLQATFSSYPAFYEMLDMNFRNEVDLHSYDPNYKMYTLNRMLGFSQQLQLKNN